MNNLSDDQISQSVAIIGMAGRFPGAESISQFWRNLLDGTCTLELLNDDGLKASGVPEEIVKDPRCIKRAGILHDSDMFDAPFFNYSRREAELIDPQQRLFLEIAWEAFEDAGYTPESVRGSVGVFGGAGMNYYFIKNILSQHKRFEDIVDFLTFIGNDKDYLCSRVSYKLGLTGPSFVVNSACSTSLVAVQVGYQSLLTGQCDYALCGGVSLQSPRARASIYNEGEIFSPEGRCKTFDKNADGMVFGEGLGLVMLKRTEEALQDRDHIYAIIRSAVVNNDGSAKAGYTAPGFDSQADLIALAQEVAGVHPEEIAFIEAHGTATRLGDAIEVSALTKAFRRGTSRKRYCALGSVKTNIGHLDTAAGVTGLIKTALSLKHRTLPASLNFTEENPELNLGSSPFFVAKDKILWEQQDTPLIAGLSSFGMGGTNAHVILQEPPIRPESKKLRRWYLVPMSAQTEPALNRSRERLQAFLKQHGNISLQDLAFTLQTGRRAFTTRTFAVCTETSELISSLSDTATGAKKCSSTQASQPVIFAFSGQGAQYPGMGRQLYESEKIIRDILDKAREIMRTETGEDLFSVLFPTDTNSEVSVQTLSRTIYTQPALFALEYALARLFMSCGITPAACIGHSIGEYTAAAIAGVFSFEQGMKIVLRRGKIMDAMERGSMAFAALPEKELQTYINGNLVIALVNGPSSCVAAGPSDEIASFIETMKKKNVRCGLLQTSHAFHSPMMDKAAQQLKEFLDGVKLSRPAVPFISNVSGTWITGEQCTSSSYWADHLRKTVRFSDGITELLNKNYRLFLEIGPGSTLSTLIGMHEPEKGQITTIQSLHHGNQKADDDRFFTSAIGELWTSGVTVDWSGFYPGDIPNKIPLPTYAFEHKRYWIEYSPPGHAAISEQNFDSEDTADQVAQDDTTAEAMQMADLTSRESLFNLVTSAWRAVLRIDQCDPDESFVVLGGNSLMLSQVVSRINQRLPYILHMSFLMGSYTINEQVERLLEFGRTNPGTTAQTINEPVPHAQEPTLSPAQQRLWYLCQLNQHTPAFNLTHTFRLRGPLDVVRLEDAVKTIAERHPSLRSTFSHINGVPIVRVIEQLPVSIAVTDCIGTSPEESEKLAADHIRKEAAILYDLETGPLFKCRLYHVTEKEYIFVFYIHHIISDGWSMAIILKELSALYNAPEGKRDTVLDTLKISYFDYAAYMNRLEERPVHGDDNAFWKEYFKDGLPILALPTDFPRPKTLKFTAKLLTFTLPPELLRKITAYAGAKKVTPFSILLAMYGLLLYRNSRQESIVIGCPIAGRNRVEFEPLIGLFLNMIPFNIKFDPGMTIEALATATYHNTVQVFAHQNLQFGKLVELLQPERHLNINHVFQTMFAYNNYLFSDNTPGEVTFEPEKSDRGSSEYDLSLYMWSADDTLHGAFEYNNELFLESTIQGLFSQFKVLLEAAVADPATSISKAPVFTDRQIAALIEQKYVTDCDLQGYTTVPALLERSFRENRQSIAITDGIRSLRYDELDMLSNQVCNGLRQAGVDHGTLVGVNMSRSINLLPVLLGILKAGAAYIPLDPLFPAERIDHMITDAVLRFIVADIPNGKRFTGNDAIRIFTYDDTGNEFANQSSVQVQEYGDGESLAYILYTSGSTGTPKGVEIQHKALVNFLQSMQKAPGITRDDRLLAVTTISFDISGLELFLPLTAGATIILVDSNVAADAFELKKRLETAGPTIMQATPATWRMLLEAGWKNGSGFKVLCGGEAMSRELADNLLATGAEVWNMYGPTETTIWSSISKVLPGKKEPDLGVPVDNTQFFFLDDALQEVPRGVIAELCIGGTGLARGYHNNSDLTSKKFVTIDIGGKTVRVYRTGDLVRTKADGTIEFLGRGDQQVKIRGYRIELEEIEIQLNKHSSVKQAIVSTYAATSGKELVAYIQLHDGYRIDAASIREHLGVHLPHYMIPAAIVEIDTFPLTPNGKVDRKKLPAPQSDALILTASGPGQKPRDAFEEQLVGIWERFIGKKVNSIDDNYFELGGHSLLAVQIFNELHKEFDIRLPLAVLIEHPTIRTFATYLRKLLNMPEFTGETIDSDDDSPASASPVQGLRLGYNSKGQPAWYVTDQNNSKRFVPLKNDENVPENPFIISQKSVTVTPAQQEIWNLIQADEKAGSAFNEAIAIRMEGQINNEAMNEAIQSLAVMHEILRSHFTADGKELIIEPSVRIPVERHMPDSSSADAFPEKVQSTESDMLQRTYDLITGPLVRVAILESKDKGCTILLGVHSSVVDLWSLNTLSRDLVKLYLSIAARESPCTLPAYGYSDYAYIRTQIINSIQMHNTFLFWRSQLAPLPPPLSIVNDTNFSLPISNNKGTTINRIDYSDFLRIKSFAQLNSVSLFSVLFACFISRLQSLSKLNDISIGIAMASPLITKLEGAVGNFSNIIPVRVRLRPGMGFSELCHYCQNLILTISSNAIIGTEELAREIGFSHKEIQALVKIRIVYVKKIEGLGHVNVAPQYIPHHVTPAEFELCIVESNDHIDLIGNCKVNTSYEIWINSFVKEISNLLHQNCDIINNKPVKHGQIFSPNNNHEQFLVEVLKQVLGIKEIGIDDNFFELGGDSASAYQVLTEILKKYDLQIPVSLFTKSNTVRSLAAQLSTIKNSQENSLPLQFSEAGITSSSKKFIWNTVVTFQKEGALPPIFCVSGAGGNPMNLLSLSKSLGMNQPFYALQFRGVDGLLPPHNNIKDMAAEFLSDIRQVQKVGPYYIGGASFGGMVAYELAQQFLQMGETVGGLFLIDTVNYLSLKGFVKNFILLRILKFYPKSTDYFLHLKKFLRLRILQEGKIEQNVNNPIFFDRIKSVIAYNSIASRMYRPLPININVLLIQGIHNPLPKNSKLKDTNGWGKIVPADKLIKRFVPAQHLELLKEPHVYETAKNIEEGLALMRKKYNGCNNGK